RRADGAGGDVGNGGAGRQVDVLADVAGAVGREARRPARPRGRERHARHRGGGAVGDGGRRHVTGACVFESDRVRDRRAGDGGGRIVGGLGDLQVGHGEEVAVVRGAVVVRVGVVDAGGGGYGGGVVDRAGGRRADGADGGVSDDAAGG